jgi:hypothetical protein
VGAGGARKACKNCSCGRAEAETAGVKVTLTQEMLDNPQSACGNVSGGLSCSCAPAHACEGVLRMRVWVDSDFLASEGGLSSIIRRSRMRKSSFSSRAGLGRMYALACTFSSVLKQPIIVDLEADAVTMPNVLTFSRSKLQLEVFVLTSLLCCPGCACSARWVMHFAVLAAPTVGCLPLRLARRLS